MWHIVRIIPGCFEKCRPDIPLSRHPRRIDSVRKSREEAPVSGQAESELKSGRALEEDYQRSGRKGQEPDTLVEI